jgi:hypothetical protein
MTLGELIKLARIRLDDRVPEYLWSDAELTEFANAAVEEVADRTRCLRDTYETPTTAGAPDYTFPFTPLWVHRAWYTNPANGVREQVKFSSTQEFFTLTQFGNFPGPTPKFFASADTWDTVRLNPIPSEVGTLDFEYSRLPNEDERMVGMGDEPIIPAEMHRDLVHWIVFEAFSLRDADTKDANAADKAEAKFDRRFGPKVSGKMRMAAHTIGVNENVYPVRFGGI